MICPFRAFLRRVLAFVFSDSLGERVAMDAEHGGGVGDVLLMTGEGFLDV